ncbi:MAG: SBBP repeat-containing protein [Ignavibacteria bacterium]|nr:SBBP repeat-containing protein [Ignavibacteria bacterium]
MISYTYYGGTGEDRITAVTKDVANNIVVTGETTSTDLPTTSPVTFPLIVKYEIPWTFPKQYLEMPGGGGNVGQVDGFVSVFTATGSIRHSRFYGGDGVESFTSMALDASGNVYLTGSTTSSNFETAPHKNEYLSQNSHHSMQPSMVARLMRSS